MAVVCVFCASSLDIPSRYVDLATRVGTELARRGHELVSGGGKVSCMGAVARAARAGGAYTVGVIPEALVLLEVADDDADELIVTPDMRSRKGEMDARADAFLVLPGGLGTLEEMLEIWVSAVLSMHRKQIERLVELGFVRRESVDVVGWVRDVPDAFELIERPEQLPRATI
jgi:uncharacterized protein (TIGR00730 family)